MIEKILVAYDNGIKSQKALEMAVDIARLSQAEIYILTSVKMPRFITSVASHETLDRLEEQSREYFDNILKDAEEKVKKEGITVRSVILQDSPGEAIVRFAEKEKIDLIAIGAHNRKPVERFLLGLGSVSNYVINHAPCPVLLAKV